MGDFLRFCFAVCAIVAVTMTARQGFVYAQRLITAQVATTYNPQLIVGDDPAAQQLRSDLSQIRTTYDQSSRSSSF